MNKPSTLTIAILLAVASGTLLAAPAVFWKWRSKLDGKEVCSQTPLGSGWEKARGPFRDSQCEKSVQAK